MYRIVVADDEQLECEVLRKVLSEFLDDARIVQASNGREALSAARRIHADLAILDIEMPGMGGIEAARHIRAELPDCRIVFLSAYSEFGYARQAVELGAVNYLLKPCSDRDLQGVVSRVITQIDAQREKEQVSRLSSRKIENLTQWLEEQLVLTVMGGYLRPERVQSQLEELGIRFCSGAFAIMRSPDGVSTERIREEVKEVRWPEGVSLIPYEYDDRLYLFAISSNGGDCSKLLKSSMETLSDRIAKAGGKCLFCAVGGCFDRLEDAQNSYYQAQSALAHCTPVHRVCGTQDILEEQHERTDFESAVSRCVMEGNAEEAAKMMGMAVEGLCAQQLEYQSVLEKVEKRLGGVLNRIQEETGVDYRNLMNLQERFSCLERIEELGTAASAALRELTAEVNGTRGSRMTQIIQEIADYIGRNYQRDIFLQQVAREMNYSDAYFSKLFKQCFHKNFITYLTETRVEAAKALLRNPTVNIKEIGAQVGYQDSNYFTKVFRRATGKNPSEYRAGVLSDMIG